MKRLIALLLALLLTVPACAESTSEWYGYEPVLDMFWTAIEENWAGDWDRLEEHGFLEPDMFPDSYGEYGFIFRDLDADGVYELIVFPASYMQPESEAYLTAIYTMKDGEPVMIAQGIHRAQIFLHDSGMIYHKGSGGDYAQRHALCMLANGEFVAAEQVTVVLDSTSGQETYCWYYQKGDAEPVQVMAPTAMQYQHRYEFHTLRDVPDFVPFSAYTPVNIPE